MDSLAVMLAQACSINSAKYFPADDQVEAKNYREEDKRSYFRGHWGAPRHVHGPAKAAIQCLQLSGA